MKHKPSRGRSSVEFSRVSGEARAIVQTLESSVRKVSSSQSNPRWLLAVRQFKSKTADAKEVLNHLAAEIAGFTGTDAMWESVDIERAKAVFDGVMAKGLAYGGAGPFRESWVTNRELFVSLFRNGALWFSGHKLSPATFDAALGVVDRDLVGLAWQMAED